MKRIPGVDLMFIAEIVPPADSSAEILEPGNMYDGDKLDEEETPLVKNTLRTTFTGLLIGKGYSFNIRTIVNGQMICQQTQQRTTGLQSNVGIVKDSDN